MNRVMEVERGRGKIMVWLTCKGSVHISSHDPKLLTVIVSVNCFMTNKCCLLVTKSLIPWNTNLCFECRPHPTTAHKRLSQTPSQTSLAKSTPWKLNSKMLSESSKREEGNEAEHFTSTHQSYLYLYFLTMSLFKSTNIFSILQFPKK